MYKKTIKLASILMAFCFIMLCKNVLTNLSIGIGQDGYTMYALISILAVIVCGGFTLLVLYENLFAKNDSEYHYIDILKWKREQRRCSRMN